MRWFFSGLLAIGLMTAIDAGPVAAAPPGNSPYCIKGCDFGDDGIGDCSFSSYAQCQATASGRTATCATNPYFSNAAVQPARTRVSRRRY